MKRLFLLSVSVLLNATFIASGQNKAFEDVYQLINQKNFFQAKEIYGTTKDNLTPTQQKVIEAFLDNAFGKLSVSNEKIAELSQDQISQFPDSLQVALFEIKEDNFIKLFEYKEAKKTTEYILENYRDLLSEEEVKDYQNSLNGLAVLENQPKQTVTIREDNKMKIKKDKFGMKNLTITKDELSFDFLFDTGANFSVVALSVAEKLNMNIFPVSIEIGGSTGAKVPLQIAVCPEFFLGNISVKNAVFLVADDKVLTFSLLFIKYKCLGIIGYPVIEALKEIQMTKDGYFIVPEKETIFSTSNLAMAGLKSLISIEGNPYHFDTGAKVTTFSKPYYLANKEEIEKKYKQSTVKRRGLGGKTKMKVYKIDAKINVLGKEVILRKVSVSKEDLLNHKSLWGRIGQDLIGEFETMTLNFNQMFIKFD